jgi:hypothetical protein
VHSFLQTKVRNKNTKDTNKPCNSISLSITFFCCGGCIAFAKNALIDPNPSNFTRNATSCSGVRKISGVECDSNDAKLGKRIRNNQKQKQLPCT